MGPLVQAQVYRWVEAEETIHYSTGLESVPEAYRDGARLLSGAPRPVGPTRIAFTPGTPIRVSALTDGQGPVTLVLDTGADRTMVSPAGWSASASRRRAGPAPGSAA